LDHHSRHHADFGLIGPDEYQNLADNFLGSPKSNDVHECVRTDGDIVRYNPLTNEFGVMSADRTILTYYKPDPWNKAKYPTNMDYFREQCK